MFFQPRWTQGCALWRPFVLAVVVTGLSPAELLWMDGHRDVGMTWEVARLKGDLFPLRRQVHMYVLQNVLVCLNMNSPTGVKSKVFRNLQGLGVRERF